MERRHQEFLKDDEFIDILQCIAEPCKEFVARSPIKRPFAPIKDLVRLLVENMRCEATIVLEEELRELIEAFFLVTVAIALFITLTFFA